MSTSDWDNDDACENCCQLACPAAHGGDINVCQMLRHHEGSRVVGEVEAGQGIGGTVAEASLTARGVAP